MSVTKIWLLAHKDTYQNRYDSFYLKTPTVMYSNMMIAISTDSALVSPYFKNNDDNYHDEYDYSQTP